MSETKWTPGPRGDAPEMYEALDEMRTACAAMFRVFEELGSEAIDKLESELFIAGVTEGFGARASAALAKARGEL